MFLQNVPNMIAMAVIQAEKYDKKAFLLFIYVFQTLYFHPLHNSVPLFTQWNCSTF